MKPRYVLIFIVIVTGAWVSYFLIFNNLRSKETQTAEYYEAVVNRARQFDKISTDTISVADNKIISKLTQEIDDNVMKLFLLEGFVVSNFNRNLITVTDKRASIYNLNLIRSGNQNLCKLAMASKHQLDEFEDAKENLNGSIKQLGNVYAEKNELIADYRHVSLLILVFISLIGLLSFIWSAYRSLYLPLVEVEKFTSQLSCGNSSYNSLKAKSKLFNKLYANLNQLGERIESASGFIIDVGENNFQSEIEICGENDQLGKSLNSLKEKLVKVREEDLNRHWLNEGLNKFHEIIRVHQDDLEELAKKVINELIQYTSTNQGAIFKLSEEDNDSLNLLAAYAWGRQKYFDKIVNVKDTLIGQAILEKSSIQIDDIPEDYVEITSGLGRSTPKFITIVPLIYNDLCYGAIELGSFKSLNETELTFLDKLAENLAASFFTIASNSETKQLLQASQQQAEQLKIQEEELRQNEEELQAAQENLSKKLEEATLEMKYQLVKVEAEKLKNLAILEGNEDAVIMFRQDGSIEFVNSSAAQLFSVEKEEIVGSQIEELIPVNLVAQNGKSQIYFTGNDQFIPLELRTEINMEDKEGNELSLLITTSSGKVDQETTYAFFIQRISVELF